MTCVYRTDHDENVHEVVFGGEPGGEGPMIWSQTIHDFIEENGVGTFHNREVRFGDHHYLTLCFSDEQTAILTKLKFG